MILTKEQENKLVNVMAELNVLRAEVTFEDADIYSVIHKGKAHDVSEGQSITYVNTLGNGNLAAAYKEYLTDNEFIVADIISQVEVVLYYVEYMYTVDSYGVLNLEFKLIKLSENDIEYIKNHTFFYLINTPDELAKVYPGFNKELLELFSNNIMRKDLFINYSKFEDTPISKFFLNPVEIDEVPNFKTLIWAAGEVDGHNSIDSIYNKNHVTLINSFLNSNELFYGNLHFNFSSSNSRMNYFNLVLKAVEILEENDADINYEALGIMCTLYTSLKMQDDLNTVIRYMSGEQRHGVNIDDFNKTITYLADGLKEGVLMFAVKHLYLINIVSLITATRFVRDNNPTREEMYKYFNSPWYRSDIKDIREIEDLSFAIEEVFGEEIL